MKTMSWTRGHTVGRGSTAIVSAAANSSTGEIFAVKTTELSKSEFLQKEQKILSTLESPFIVGYKGYDITMENNKLMFNLMLEYFPDGTVSDAIHRRGGGLEESTISYCARGVVEGLEYLHSNGVVHCDIKGRNILLGKNGPKIADFGCAKWVAPAIGIGNREITTAAAGGTPLFMSPEVARGEDQGFPADIWALGCLVIEMAAGGSPWPNATSAESLMYRVGFSGDLPEIPEFLSDQAKNFLGKCLKKDPKERWTAKQLLNHQFLGLIDSPAAAGPVPKQSPEFNSSSPTCVLDQGIWNSVGEESETVNDESTTRHSSPDFCPAQRVQCLCSDSGEPNWDWDESWIVVRSDENEEKGNWDVEICGSLNDVPCDDGVKLESRNSGDENSMNFLDENVSSKGRCCGDKISISRCREHDERFVLSNVNFEMLRQNPELNQIHFL